MNRAEERRTDEEESDRVLLLNSSLLFLVNSDISGDQPWHTCAVLAREILTQRGIDVDRALENRRSGSIFLEKELALFC
jgi:hypothetical protein